jgi:hypothetical protein
VIGLSRLEDGQQNVEIQEDLEEIESLLSDLKNHLRKMDPHAPPYLRDSLNDLKQLGFQFYKILRHLQQ